jgi:D-arabinose 1-dehydrogenase-like Zn-dependent alcohol dehydrogenase
VSVCAVCRTDIHVAEGDLALHKGPVVPGHQIVGRIDQVGAGVNRLRQVDGICSAVRHTSLFKIALARGHEVYVVTRSANHIQQAKTLAAAWAGADFRELPEKADAAILFVPSGKLVPPTLEALARGGICAIAGIHLTDLPELNYAKHLYQERELRSVTANTREDARAFLAEAAAANIRPQTKSYSLEDANHALRDMKES